MAFLVYNLIPAFLCRFIFEFDYKGNRILPFFL